MIYACNYIDNAIEPIVLPQNAENFLNTEAEYLRYCGEWKNGVSLEDAANLFARDDA